MGGWVVGRASVSCAWVGRKDDGDVAFASSARSSPCPALILRPLALSLLCFTHPLNLLPSLRQLGAQLALRRLRSLHLGHCLLQ